MEIPSVSRPGRAVLESSEVQDKDRQKLNLHPIRDSLCREQRKLRHALDWAQRFLSMGSQVHQELCRADGLTLASEEKEYNSLAPHETFFSEDTTDQNDNIMSEASGVNINIPEVMSKQVLQSQGRRSQCEKVQESVGMEHNSASKMASPVDDDDAEDSSLDGPHSKAVSKQVAGSPSHRYLEIPSNLSVYEQYLLCVEQLHQMRPSRDVGNQLDCPKTEQWTRQKMIALDNTSNPKSKIPDTNICLNTLEVKVASSVTVDVTNENQGNMELTRSFGLKNQEASKKTSFSQEKDTNKRTVDADLIINVERRSSTDDISGKTKLVGNVIKDTDCPTEVTVSWMSLPDEVWLRILSLLHPISLCKTAQVCSGLYRLTTDHTLWKNIRIENATLTDRWLLSVARRHPHSLCLYNCSGQSLTCSGLEKVLTLCRNDLKEIKAISCTAPSLHGDKVLSLTAHLCGHVTSVDVSWSGATDAGLTALRGSNRRLRLKSVVLNGCHVSDEPLKKLIMRHRESLYRLEVFGCQYITSSCLQTICEMCPRLKHFNIGQVPKVKETSLSVMMSQLKFLLSLNVTGLQAVTDATVATVLQQCVTLQRLTLSFCPGITDLTLQNIGKYAPCLRSLDVSYCKAVTDTGVQALSLGCRKLEQLDLSSTSTGNTGVGLLASYCSGRLHTVKLSFLHISSEKILMLCSNSQRLKILHLYGCVQLPAETEIREVNSNVQVYPQYKNSLS